MSTFRRILLSFACVVLAIAALFLLSLFGLVGSHAQRLGQLQSMAQIFLVYFLFALPGWLIALPFVVLLENAQGWRGWAILLIGTCIGPCFILLWSLIESSGHSTWQGDGFVLVASLIISLLTTVCYILTLKLAHRRSIAAGQ
jgi:hypothetical protein